MWPATLQLKTLTCGALPTGKELPSNIPVTILVCGRQERAAGLEAVDGMLAAFGGRIGPNVGDLMGALKVHSITAPIAHLTVDAVDDGPPAVADELVLPTGWITSAG